MNTTADRPARLSLIAAVARHGGIGLENRLLFDLPEDLRHFRRVTMGCPVIMGRKTWDSLPAAFRPLPGRRNVVLSRSPQPVCVGAEQATSLPQALALLREAPRVFVIGGAQIYAEALPLADELILTEVQAEPPADAFFPDWNRRDFHEVQRESIPANDGPPARPAFAFVTYQRTA